MLPTVIKQKKIPQFVRQDELQQKLLKKNTMDNTDETIKYKCPKHNKQDITRICVTKGCTKNALMCDSCQQQHRHQQTHILSFPNPFLFRTLPQKQSKSLQKILDQYLSDMTSLQLDIKSRLDQIITQIFIIFDQIIQRYRPKPDILPQEMRTKTGNQMHPYYLLNRNSELFKQVSVPPRLTVELLEWKVLFKEVIPKLEDFAKTTQLFDFYKCRGGEGEKKKEAFVFEERSMKDVAARFEKILEFKGKEVYTPNYQTLAKQLKDLNSSKQQGLVLEKCEQAMMEDPLAAPAYFEKGFALFDQGNFLQAFVGYSICGELGTSPFLAHTNRAICLIREGMYESAIRACDMALQHNKSYANALCNKGVSYQNLKKYDEALLFYQKAIKVKPDFKVAKDLTNLLLAKMEGGGSTISKASTIQS